MASEEDEDNEVFFFGGDGLLRLFMVWESMETS
jgi:hypothetical protein